jgi:hypothetical protein
MQFLSKNENFCIDYIPGYLLLQTIYTIIYGSFLIEGELKKGRCCDPPVSVLYMLPKA